MEATLSAIPTSQPGVRPVDEHEQRDIRPWQVIYMHHADAWMRHCGVLGTLNFVIVRLATLPDVRQAL